jgi:regulator of sirC expression with transglutaminase-like and TPR domain
MSQKEEVIHLSPSESDKDILQRTEEDPSEATTTQVAISFKSPSSVTDPGLVMRQLRMMNVKLEELQQDALQTKMAAAYREI